MELTYQENHVCFVHHLLQQTIWYTHHTKMCMVTADESPRPSNLSNTLFENELVSTLGL